MSDVSTPTRRPVGTWITVASVAVLMVAAVMLFGPAIEELREEATRSQRGNVLSKVALAAAPHQADSWSPVWDGPGGAVPDYLADTPASLTHLVPANRWAVTRSVASTIPSINEVEPIVGSPPNATVPGYSPNWDLLEPVGIRQLPRTRRTRIMPDSAMVKPALESPSSNIRRASDDISAPLVVD